MRRAPLQAEADTTLTDNNGDTALQHAEAEGHESVAQLIRLHEVEEGVTRCMCDICVSDEKTHMVSRRGEIGSERAQVVL